MDAALSNPRFVDQARLYPPPRQLICYPPWPALILKVNLPWARLCSNELAIVSDGDRGFGKAVLLGPVSSQHCGPHSAMVGGIKLREGRL
jgi:hypothetical protein